jgi:DNA mismatch endonuclease (patch repair protein)
LDIWPKNKRSEVMSKIRGKDTKPELTLRSALHRLGFRFRIHRKDLPGKPDIVLTKYQTVIFVHGCFWHFHQQCRAGRVPSSNSVFWKEKFDRNTARDLRNYKALEKLGWRVLVVWECEINTRAGITKKIENLSNQIKGLEANYKPL